LLFQRWRRKIERPNKQQECIKNSMELLAFATSTSSHSGQIHRNVLATIGQACHCPQSASDQCRPGGQDALKDYCMKVQAARVTRDLWSTRPQPARRPFQCHTPRYQRFQPRWKSQQSDQWPAHQTGLVISLTQSNPCPRALALMIVIPPPSLLPPRWNDQIVGCMGNQLMSFHYELLMGHSFQWSCEHGDMVQQVAFQNELDEIKILLKIRCP